MNLDRDRLYRLLPVVYQQRDVEYGTPLKALLAVISEQVNALDQDISQLYDNWFIETCEDWAVPYIGDLIGFEAATPSSLPDELSSESGRLLEKTLIPRREVANALALRGRKGTFGVLEEVATALTGWPARTVEFHRRLAVTQALNHRQPYRGHTVNLRSAPALARLGGAFDDLAHTVEVGRMDSHRTRGRYGVANAGVYLWPLNVYALNHVPAYLLEDVGDHCFTFSSLGNDVPLYARNSLPRQPAHAARPAAFPGPISRASLTEWVEHKHRERLRASTEYYGADKSVAVWAPGWGPADASKPVPAERVIPADLSGWHFRPPPGYIALDPQLGRIAFPPGDLPTGGVWVSYGYGFVDNIGGGPYPRQLSYERALRCYFVGTGAQYPTIAAALEAWADEAPARAALELIDSEVYQDQVRINLAVDQSLEIRARSGTRPVLHLLDRHANRPDALVVSGTAGSAFRMSGLLIVGCAVEVHGAVSGFTLRDCTLVPGSRPESQTKARPTARRNSEPSLVLVNSTARVYLERSIVGAIRVVRTEAHTEPCTLSVVHSIVDAAGNDSPAIGGEDGRIAALVLHAKRSTILGQIHVHQIALAEDTIFSAAVRVARRQKGCMRFCYVSHDSLTPTRYACQPDLIEQRLAASLVGEHLSTADRAALVTSERHRVAPEFDSTRYGTPYYCRLAQRCADEIRRGAHDASEMGVFHDRFEPQRLQMLRARIKESVPLGVEAAVFLVD